MAVDDAEPSEHDERGDGANEGRRLSRRAVVVGLGGAATAAAVAVLVGTQLDDGGDDGTSGPASGGTAGAGSPTDDEAVRRVGEAYRAAYPEEDDVEVLRAALPDFTGLSADEVEARLHTLRDQVRADFVEGHVVMVDGWLLAATEARAAALVSLLA